MDHSAVVEKAIAQCSGPFSTLTLHQTYLSIDRSQFICDVHEVVFRSHPIRKSRIELAEITELGLTASMLLPPLFVVRFAGCAQLTGSILHDAILGNVHMLSFLDNRPFYELYRLLEDMILARRPPAERAGVVAGPPSPGRPSTGRPSIRSFP